MEICGSSSSSSSSSSDEIHQPTLRSAKYVYSRHDLLSFGEPKHCRNIPNGLITSNLKELGIASSCMQDLFNGENQQGLLRSPEDDFCGRRSYRLSSTSKENKDVIGEVISVANDCCQLKKSANPYRPPHSRTKTDHSSSQGASSGTGSDCDSNSIIFYEIAEEQQRKGNQSRSDEDDEDWDEIMSILRVEQESLISDEAKDDQTVTSTENQSNYDDDDQTLNKTTTEICLPDEDDLITTKDLLVLEPMFEYSLPDEDSLISVHDFVNPHHGKIDQENFHRYKHQYCQEHRMNSQGSSGSFMNEMVNRSSNYYYTSNNNRISSMTKMHDHLLAARYYQESLQTTPLPYGFYQESNGVDHLTDPNYPYQIYPSNNPNRWSLDKSYMDPGAGFERQSRSSSLDMHVNKMNATRKHFTLTGSSIQQLTR